MAKKIDANRTVTITILARHAYNLAAAAERIRLDHFKSCGEDDSPEMKEMLKRSSDEWKKTAHALAAADNSSLRGRGES